MIAQLKSEPLEMLFPSINVAITAIGMKAILKLSLSVAVAAITLITAETNFIASVTLGDVYLLT